MATGDVAFGHVPHHLCWVISNIAGATLIGTRHHVPWLHPLMGQTIDSVVDGRYDLVFLIHATHRKLVARWDNRAF